uniref:ATP synthase subunit a n=1 Tax=Melamphaus rubrocinctus TaxID=238647 RepID=A0A4Y1JVT4_9HEMI|nr:ATP synthase F0 subunit 6 [Melamphaus rubrocinctus]APO08862.1 ATP synthase F0 subunit 6 [Melamphaus rubrocinctus]
MMTNLFSAFDPVTSKNLSLNWLSMILIMLITPMNFWMIPSKMMIIKNKLITTLTQEFKTLLGPSLKGFTMIPMALFIFILINNMMGLLPYIFTSSSHMTFTLTLALPLWMSLMLYGWINQMNNMFSHLVPVGTPSLLMPFMVIIETLSNLIRPGALAVRLMANMIAGHLLMSLLGNSTTTVSLNILPIMSTQMLLMLFETAVAMIQAYVFSILMTLYTSELH